MLFLDEIHRFSKAQQDALLPWVESGVLTLIGATTDHPGLAITNALLSRSQIYAVEPLGRQAMRELFERAQGSLSVRFEPGAIDVASDLADGDGRRFLNLLELVDNAARAKKMPAATAELAASSVASSLARFDKEGDLHHEMLSAFHKSLRGSSPDGALYWLARLLGGGADPKHVCRRMVAMASEDVGNADPEALRMAVDAALAYDRLGSPEGELNLAHAAVYLAMAPKSNAVYEAWNAAKREAREGGSKPVPIHLRNAPSKLMAQMGYGADYRYAHSEASGFAAGQRYFPEGMGDPHWYRPTDRGFEKRIQEKLERLNALDAEARAGRPKT